jgi:hypothetical protein
MANWIVSISAILVASKPSQQEELSSHSPAMANHTTEAIAGNINTASGDDF